MNPIQSQAFMPMQSWQYTNATQAIKPALAGAETAKSAASVTPAGEMFGKLLSQVNESQTQSQQAVQEFALGKQDILAVTMAMNQAGLSLKLAVEVRNKALEAYQDIMRTTV